MFKPVECVANQYFRYLFCYAHLSWPFLQLLTLSNLNLKSHNLVTAILYHFAWTGQK